MLITNKKRWSSNAVCINESQKHYSEQKNPARKEYIIILYDSICMKCYSRSTDLWWQKVDLCLESKLWLALTTSGFNKIWGGSWWKCFMSYDFVYMGIDVCQNLDL